MAFPLDPDSITHGIQLAVAPVFLLTAVSGMIGAVAGRLARIIDRARLVEERARDSTDAVLLTRTTTELGELRFSRGAFTFPLGRPNDHRFDQRGGGALLQLGLGLLVAEHPLHRQVHVLEAGQPGQQRMVLEHHRTLGARPGNFAVGAQQVSLRGHGQAGQQVEQGGFAAARVANQCHKLAFGHRQVDVPQCAERPLLGFESLFNTGDFDVLAGQVVTHDFTSSNVNAVAILIRANSRISPTMPMISFCFEAIAKSLRCKNGRDLYGSWKSPAIEIWVGSGPFHCLETTRAEFSNDRKLSARKVHFRFDAEWSIRTLPERMVTSSVVGSRSNSPPMSGLSSASGVSAS